MKNGIYFIVIAFWVGKSFKIWIYANWRSCDLTTWTQNYVKSQNMHYLCQYYVYRVDVLQELHIVIVVMMSP